MKEYRVIVTAPHSHEVTCQAEDEQAAIAIALEMLSDLKIEEIFDLDFSVAEEP
jgi:hypothetical protein